MSLITKLFSLKCKNNIYLVFVIITVIIMLTFYECFYCTVINNYL